MSATVSHAKDHEQKIVVSPDGRWVFAQTYKSRVLVWRIAGQDPGAWQFLMEIKCCSSNKDKARDIDVSGDGNRAAIACTHSVEIWSADLEDTSAWTRLGILETKHDRLASISLSANGAVLGIAAGKEGAAIWEITQLDFRQWRLLSMLELNDVYEIKLSRNGTRALTRHSKEKRAYMWDRASSDSDKWNLIAELQTHGGAGIMRIQLSAEGCHAMTSSTSEDFGVLTWVAEKPTCSDWKRNHMITLPSYTYDVRMSADGLIASTVSNDHWARVWDLSRTSVQLLNTFKLSHSQNNCALTSDGGLLVIATSSIQIKVWAIFGSAIEYSSIPMKLDALKNLAYAGNGEKAAAISWRGFFDIWTRSAEGSWKHSGTLPNVRKGDKVTKMQISTMVLSQDATLAAGGTHQGEVVLWDIRSYDVGQWRVMHSASPKKGPITFISLSRDMQKIAVVTRRKAFAAYLWDLQRKDVQELKADKFAIDTLAFSLDGASIGGNCRSCTDSPIDSPAAIWNTTLLDEYIEPTDVLAPVDGAFLTGIVFTERGIFAAVKEDGMYVVLGMSGTPSSDSAWQKWATLETGVKSIISTIETSADGTILAYTVNDEFKVWRLRGNPDLWVPVVPMTNTSGTMQFFRSDQILIPSNDGLRYIFGKQRDGVEFLEIRKDNPCLWKTMSGKSSTADAIEQRQLPGGVTNTNIGDCEGVSRPEPDIGDVWRHSGTRSLLAAFGSYPHSFITTSPCDIPGIQCAEQRSSDSALAHVVLHALRKTRVDWELVHYATLILPAIEKLTLKDLGSYSLGSSGMALPCSQSLAFENSLKFVVSSSVFFRLDAAKCWQRVDVADTGLIGDLDSELQLEQLEFANLSGTLISHVSPSWFQNTSVDLKHAPFFVPPVANIPSESQCKECFVLEDDHCRVFSAGYSVGIVYFDMCPAGQWRNAALRRCQECPSDHFNSYRGRISIDDCLPCPGFMTADRGASKCEPPLDPLWDDLLVGIDFGACLLWLLVSPGIVLLVATLAETLAIEDIYLKHSEDFNQTGKVIVETVLEHGLRPFTTADLLYRGAALVPITLRNTGHLLLDSKGGEIKSFKARCIDGKHFELLDCHGEAIQVRVDASQGSASVPFPWYILKLGHMGMRNSTFIGLLALLIGFTILFGENAKTVGTVLTPTCTIFGCFMRWRRKKQITKLHMSCVDYINGIRQANPVYQECERGANRGITASCLHGFSNSFYAFIRDRAMHYTVNNLILPITAESKTSFAEFVGAVPLTWFVSHSWTHPFKEFSESVVAHAKESGTEFWERQGYWICSFSNNQYEVEIEVGSGDWKQSSFYKALRSRRTRGTVMIIDERAETLTRSWCLFELLQTFVLQQTRTEFEGLYLCTPSGVMNSGNVGLEVAISIARALSSVSVAHATASVREDKEMIDNLVKRALPGGFEAMNHYVRTTILQALRNCHSSYEDKFTKLVAEVEKRAGSDTLLDNLNLDIARAASICPHSHVESFLGSFALADVDTSRDTSFSEYLLWIDDSPESNSVASSAEIEMTIPKDGVSNSESMQSGNKTLV